MSEALLKVNHIKKFFSVKGSLFEPKKYLQAVNDISFSIQKGETLGLVGESGCGKSTLGRTILQLYKADSGSVEFEGKDITQLSANKLKPLRRNMQMIFQDPFGSLNPRMSVGEILREPLNIHNIGTRESRKEKINHLMDIVGLRKDALDRYPHEFSGGQRQRIGIARALTLDPKFIVADEPVSALDVSVQSQVLNLICDLQEQLGISFLFIAHDLAVVQHISHRVGVMYLGKIVEMATAEDIYENPKHPYTEALLSAIPIPDPTQKSKRIILKGDVPSPISPPSGCAFHKRCPYVQEKCRVDTPKLSADVHQVACHFPIN